MSRQRKYIYGIIKETQKRKFTIHGVDNQEVYSINYKNIAAIVSDTEAVETDPTRKNVLSHAAVQETLLKEYDLLPMRFGMIADSDNEVKSLLARSYEGFINELNRLSGKIEVELKIFWDQETMMKELESKNNELTKLKAKLSISKSPAEIQSLLVEAGKQVENLAKSWKATYALGVYDSLRELSAEALINEPVGVKNILNASFLIDRSKEGQFKEEIYKLDSKYQNKLIFKYVGPLPPYSFVNLKLESVK